MPGKNYIHTLEENEKCCGHGGDICIVRFGEHNIMNFETFVEWKESMEDAIEEYEG